MHLASIPICDIDPYYNNKLTFIVVSKVTGEKALRSQWATFHSFT